MLTHIIFDMDGVIIDSEPIYAAVEERRFAELGITVSDEQRAGFVGMPEREVWAYLKRAYDLTASVDELLDQAREGYQNHLDGHGPEPLVPGARMLIERLRDVGVRLAVASSSPRATIERVCTAHELRHFFDVLVGGDEVARSKPAPDIFLHAARLLEVKPMACLVIEDSARGVRAARAAGMTCVGLRNPHSGSQDLSTADLEVATLEGQAFEQICRLMSGAATRSSWRPD